eukprot:3296219-Lingulodinium_polyedra.AAC.1
MNQEYQEKDKLGKTLNYRDIGEVEFDVVGQPREVASGLGGRRMSESGAKAAKEANDELGVVEQPNCGNSRLEGEGYAPTAKVKVLEFPGTRGFWKMVGSSKGKERKGG